MAKSRSGRSKKRRFTGNRYTIRATINENDETSELNSTESASAKKLESSHTSLKIFSERLFETSKDNRIVSWTTLISFFAIVCCPDYYSQGLELMEDSVSGLCSHMNLKCKNCSFFKGFPTTEKMKGSCLINSSIFGGLRIIGKGFSAGKKLCAFLGLPFLSKLAFRNQERKLLKATERVAQENINAALSEIKGSNSFTKCGISIDGTWQRRGYSSLNGCGSAGNMEVVGAYRIFERSNVRNVQYNEYYGDGDSKGYESVKNFYGINTVTKLECIGHVQKRVGGRLRQLKKTTKGLGGKNKLTDKLINRIQNYYGIAIRSNVDSIKGTLTWLETFTSEKTVSKDTSVTEIEIKLKKIEQLQINPDKIPEDYCEIETSENLETIQLDIEDINQRIGTTELHSGACMSKYKCTVSGCKGLHNPLLNDSSELCSTVKTHIVGERGIDTTRLEGQPEVAVLTYGN
ncbi:CCHC-type domain-containing protein [Trichonephila clavipes]|nr:CCHC-type domain-containing protein [Trichonephila clavipes]